MQIDVSKLNTPEAGAYFTKNPHRLGTIRTTLDLLGIPFPKWAEREVPGRKPGGIYPAAR